MSNSMKMTRIAGPYGTDYRIGDYVVIKEDERIHGDPEEHDGTEVVSEITWGAVPATIYDRNEGRVGLPDAVYERATLRAVRAWIERSDD